MSAAAKKLLNEPDKAVLQALSGLVASSPHLNLLDDLPDTKVVYDERLVKCGKVAVISGGGSGHEPAHVGYVGEGMLSAAVCGEVFASPASTAVLAAIRKVTGEEGCLLIVTNYTGDRLNFGLAAEQARYEGYSVEMVIVGDDCAVSGGVAGRRGLAGTLFVNKAAGAAADRGEDLAVVTKIAKGVSERIGTVGVALSCCTLPGSQTSKRLGENDIEVGMGIHGEPGIELGVMAPAKDIVEQVINKIVSSENFHLESGDPIVLMINNLGATHELELSVVAREAIENIKGHGGTVIEAVYVGTFMTALDMAGISITLLKVDTDIISLLQHPTKAKAWVTEFPFYVPEKRFGSVPSAGVDVPKPARPDEVSSLGLTIEKAILEATAALISHEEELTEWDSVVGDGDCGITMTRGANAIRQDMEEKYPLNDPGALARCLATSIAHSMGGTSGALYSIFFTAASVASQDWKDPQAPTLEDWYRTFEAGVEMVRTYGGAQEGCRTMLDAMIPAREAVKKGIAQSGEVIELLKAAVDAATKGADATQDMIATAGRTSYIPEDIMKSVPDPGAKAFQYWLEGVLASLK